MKCETRKIIPTSCKIHIVALNPCDFGVYLILFSSLILGLTQIPQVLKTEISFSASDSKSYEMYVSAINKFLLTYSDEQQMGNAAFEDCGGKCP